QRRVTFTSEARERLERRLGRRAWHRPAPARGIRAHDPLSDERSPTGLPSNSRPEYGSRAGLRTIQSCLPRVAAIAASESLRPPSVRLAVVCAAAPCAAAHRRRSNAAVRFPEMIGLLAAVIGALVLLGMMGEAVR